MMKRSSVHLLAMLLCIASCGMAMVLPVTAAPSTTTVPSALEDCARDARYPDALFTCTLANTIGHGSPFPEGPPYAVNCYDQSYSRQAIASWRWDFGDGGTSSRQSPSHTYADTGSYPVTLTVTTICGSRYTATTTGSIDVYCRGAEPQFVADAESGTAPLTVHVRDTSSYAPEAITRWTYWFDDTHKSTDRNPSFTYTRPGIYTISLTATKDCVRPGLRDTPPFERKINVTAPVFSLLYTMNITNLSADTPATTATPGPLRASAQPPTLVRTTPVAVTGTATAPAPDTVHQSGDQPAPGTLSVVTDPAGAMVYVDDVLRGASPAMIPDIPAGSHTLRIVKTGYRSLNVPVTITDGKTTEYSTALVPESSGGMETLPIIAGAAVVLALAAAGAFIYLKKKAP